MQKAICLPIHSTALQVLEHVRVQPVKGLSEALELRFDALQARDAVVRPGMQGLRSLRKKGREGEREGTEREGGSGRHRGMESGIGEREETMGSDGESGSQ